MALLLDYFQRFTTSMWHRSKNTCVYVITCSMLWWCLMYVVSGDEVCWHSLTFLWFDLHFYFWGSCITINKIQACHFTVDCSNWSVSAFAFSHESEDNLSTKSHVMLQWTRNGEFLDGRNIFNGLFSIYLFVFVLCVALKKRIPSKICILCYFVWLNQQILSGPPFLRMTQLSFSWLSNVSV